MAQTTEYQQALSQKVRAAAKAIREALALAKDVKRDWESRGDTLPARQAWFETWATTAEVPFTLAEFYAGATAIFEVADFVEGVSAPAQDDRAKKLVKIRQD